MRRCQRLRALQKSRRSLFARRSRIIPASESSRSSGYPYRTSKHNGTCSWSFRLDLQTNSAGPAPREDWPVGRLIVPSTKSATVSDGRQSNMGQREGSPFRFPTNFASLPKRTSEKTQTATEQDRSVPGGRESITSPLGSACRADLLVRKLCWCVAPSG